MDVRGVVCVCECEEEQLLEPLWSQVTSRLSPSKGPGIRCCPAPEWALTVLVGEPAQGSASDSRALCLQWMLCIIALLLLSGNTDGEITGV